MTKSDVVVAATIVVTALLATANVILGGWSWCNWM